MSDVEGRIRRLEAESAEHRRQIEELRAAVALTERPVRPPAAPAAPPPRHTRFEEMTEARPIRPSPQRRPPLDVEDLATPRNLAIVGGLGVTMGLAFLVSYGIGQGWITEGLRVALAAAFSFTLALAGAVLSERNRTAPAMALVLSGLVGMFLTIVAATRLYDLIPTASGVALATLVGVAASFAALRWRSEAVACMAVGGTLIAPLLVGAEYSPGTLAFLLPVYVVAIALTVARHWPVLFAISFTIMLASVAVVQADAAFTASQAFAIAAAGALLSGVGLAGRAVIDRSEPDWQAVLYGVVAALVGVCGYLLISGAHVPRGGDAEAPENLATVWLFGFAALNGLAALGLHAIGLIDTRRAALTAAIAALAWALGEVFHGPALVVSWSAAAAVTLLAARHDWERGLALCVAGLAVVHILVHEIPIDAMVEGVDSIQAAWIAGLALFVVSASAWISGPAHWRPWAAAVGFGLLLYLTSVTIIDISQIDMTRVRRRAPVSALDSEAQGQVIVSSLWAICGLGILVAGLRRGQPLWRTGGLILLALAAGKIVLFDLAALSTAARTISFIVVGLVFLVAAFASQALAKPTRRGSQDQDLPR